MAQLKAEYEENKEFHELAQKIVEKYPNIWKVDHNRICCVAITNKERKEDKQLWKVDGVKMPMLLHSPYAWYVTIWQKDWESLNEKQKLLLIADVLCSIGEEEGAVNPLDGKDFKLMIRTFKGIDYLDDVDAPNILEQDIRWAIV